MATATISRQLPYQQFVQEIQVERKRETQEHARWAGMALAEMLVEQKKPVESLTKVQIEKMRRRYHVAQTNVKVMLETAKETYPFELAWQYSHD